MKKLIKAFFVFPALFLLLTPAFAAGLDIPNPSVSIGSGGDTGLVIDAEKDIYPGDTPDVDDRKYCYNPFGTLGSTVTEPCQNGGTKTMKCAASSQNGALYWQIITPCPSVLCIIGYTYDPAAGKCRIQCSSGKFVDNKADCCTALQTWNGTECVNKGVELLKQCTPGIKNYRRCDINGADCGTQEKTCSSAGLWSAWGECKTI